MTGGTRNPASAVRPGVQGRRLRVALIGNSNAVMHDGFAAAIDPALIEVENLSLGASPNILLLDALRLLREVPFDWIVFDTAVTDFAWIDLGLYEPATRDRVLTMFLQEICRLHGGGLLCLILPVSDPLGGEAPQPSAAMLDVLRTAPRPVHVLDLYAVHRRHAPPGPTGVSMMMRDRLHLSDMAQGLTGRLVTKALLQAEPVEMRRPLSPARGGPAPVSHLMRPVGALVPAPELRTTSLVQAECVMLPPRLPARAFAPEPVRVLALAFDRAQTCCYLALRAFDTGMEVIKDFRCQGSAADGLNLHLIPLLADLTGSSFGLEALTDPGPGPVEPGWLLDAERPLTGVGLVGMLACTEEAWAQAGWLLAVPPDRRMAAPIDVLEWPGMEALCRAAFSGGADRGAASPPLPTRAPPAAPAADSAHASDWSPPPPPRSLAHRPATGPLGAAIDRLELEAAAALPAHWEDGGAGLADGMNVVLAYGQSLSLGTSGWPALSRAPMPGNWRVGGSVRAAVSRGASAPWVPVGGAFRLEPLAAVEQHAETGAVLSAEAVRKLPDQGLHDGETVLECALADLRRRWRFRAAAEAERGGLLALAAGMPGRAIESLSPGAPSGDYERVGSALAAARGAAGAEPASVAALLWLQGENNSMAPEIGTTDTVAYGQLARALLHRLRADTARAPDRLPPVLTHQAPTWFASDTVDTAIAQAQLDLAWPRTGHAPGCVLACPAYFVTRREAHPDANGYRWLGAHFGRVLERLLLDRQGWCGVQPLAAHREGDAVLLSFLVPYPPLVLAPPPMLDHLPPHGGFACVDETGPIAVVRATVAAPHVVELRLGRQPGAQARLTYAGRHPLGGVGCLRDNDPDVSGERFEFGAIDQRHLPAAALGWDGESYPLWNWCAAFSMAV